MILERILKPWYVWRPLQLVSPARLALAPPKPGEREIRTAWGVSLLAEPRTALGWSIAATGVHDLAVTECLARLIRVGDQVLDVGAHVGYTATLARIAAGPAGHVHAWEPNPGCTLCLERNAAAVTKRYRTAAITARAAAVGAAPGKRGWFCRIANHSTMPPRISTLAPGLQTTHYSSQSKRSTTSSGMVAWAY